MRRTSLKTFIASFAFLTLGVFASSMAAKDYLPDYKFGMHPVRPWNNWDYFAICSFVLFASLAFGSFRFFKHGD
jgi:hypothetical protein